jgi:Fur family transcriptional regulator, iron response regulator
VSLVHLKHRTVTVAAPSGQFTDVGLLRQVAVDGSKAYFDTNNSEHHHFYIEDQHELMDVAPTDMIVGKAPVPPDGYEIVRFDVVIRLHRKRSNAKHLTD